MVFWIGVYFCHVCAFFRVRVQLVIGEFVLLLLLFSGTCVFVSG